MPTTCQTLQWTEDECEFVVSKRSSSANSLLQLVIVSGGNSEVPGMMPRLRYVFKEKGIISAEKPVIHLAGQSSSVLIIPLLSLGC